MSPLEDSPITHDNEFDLPRSSSKSFADSNSPGESKDNMHLNSENDERTQKKSLRSFADDEFDLSPLAAFRGLPPAG